MTINNELLALTASHIAAGMISDPDLEIMDENIDEIVAVSMHIAVRICNRSLIAANARAASSGIEIPHGSVMVPDWKVE